MPDWMEKQFDNADAAVRNWGKDKREAAGIPNTMDQSPKEINIYHSTYQLVTDQILSHLRTCALIGKTRAFFPMNNSNHLLRALTEAEVQALFITLESLDYVLSRANSSGITVHIPKALQSGSYVIARFDPDTPTIEKGLHLLDHHEGLMLDTERPTVVRLLHESSKIEEKTESEDTVTYELVRDYVFEQLNTCARLGVKTTIFRSYKQLLSGSETCPLYMLDSQQEETLLKELISCGYDLAESKDGGYLLVTIPEEPVRKSKQETSAEQDDPGVDVSKLMSFTGFNTVKMTEETAADFEKNLLELRPKLLDALFQMADQVLKDFFEGTIPTSTVQEKEGK